jgi:hypothetical protein
MTTSLAPSIVFGVQIEERIRALGIVLPESPRIPAGVRIPFAWVRTSGSHVYVSGHSPQSLDGSVAGPFGKVGAEVSLEAAYAAARAAGISMLASLKRTLGDLDRISGWLMIQGMINVNPEFVQTTHVINGASDLILNIFGQEIGAHARTAIGVASLILNLPVVISAELEIAT